MNSNKSPLIKMALVNWHEAALWGAIAIVRHFKEDVSTREIIRKYKEELDLSDEHLPEALAWNIFCRVNSKVNKARDELKRPEHKFKGDIINEIEDLRTQLDALVNAIKKQ